MAWHPTRLQRLAVLALACLIAVTIIEAGAPGMPSSDAIAYQGKSRIYFINADGSGQRVIAAGVADRTFDWSPDGRFLAFTAGKAPMRYSYEPSAIRIVDVDGTEKRLLTSEPGRTAREPTWSPDGTNIVFTGFSTRDDAWELYVIGADGKGLRKLTRGGGRYGNVGANWSPNGEWIVFESWDGRALHTMKLIHPDGTGLHSIGAFQAWHHCLCPDWSPDGTKIAYQADADPSGPDRPEIFVMNADGSGSIRLTRNRVLDENPDWSPDGTRLAFYSTRYGNAEIFVIDATGRNVRRVTHDPWYSQLPRWRPSP